MATRVKQSDARCMTFTYLVLRLPSFPFSSFSI